MNPRLAPTEPEVTLPMEPEKLVESAEALANSARALAKQAEGVLAQATQVVVAQGEPAAPYQHYHTSTWVDPDTKTGTPAGGDASTNEWRGSCQDSWCCVIYSLAGVSCEQ